MQLAYSRLLCTLQAVLSSRNKIILSDFVKIIQFDLKSANKNKKLSRIFMN